MSKSTFLGGLVLIAGLAVQAFAQPTINKNFVSLEALSAGADSGSFRVYNWNATIYVDPSGNSIYSGNAVRIDTTQGNTKPTYYQFYPGYTNPISDKPNDPYCVAQFAQGAHECGSWNPVVPANSPIGYQFTLVNPTTCTVEPIKRSSPAAFFDFLVTSQQDGACSSNGKSGTLWWDSNSGLALCANGNTPISLAHASSASAATAAAPYLTFATFTPGVPSAFTFEIPTSCGLLPLPTAAPAPGTCDSVYGVSAPQASLHGDLVVKPNQNCIVAGGQTGGILQVGGNLLLAGTTVNGSLWSLGSGSLALGQSTQILGDLNIGLLSPNPNATAPNQICGVSIGRDFNYLASGAAVAIGDACAGNTIGRDVNIQLNTGAVAFTGNAVHRDVEIEANHGPVSVVGNTIGKSLDCKANSSITGSGNTATIRWAQCAAF